MNILDYIPEGKENAARASDISRWTGLDERYVRELISVARQSTVIINLQDRNGYFRPTEDESSLVLEWVKQEESRLRRHALSLRAARKFLKEEGDARITDFLQELYGSDGGPDSGTVQEADDGHGTLCNG